jgi:hypothetical protein
MNGSLFHFRLWIGRFGLVLVCILLFGLFAFFVPFSGISAYAQSSIILDPVPTSVAPRQVILLSGILQTNTYCHYSVVGTLYNSSSQSVAHVNFSPPADSPCVPVSNFPFSVSFPAPSFPGLYSLNLQVCAQFVACSSFIRPITVDSSLTTPSPSSSPTSSGSSSVSLTLSPSLSQFLSRLLYTLFVHATCLCITWVFWLLT